MTRYTTPDDHYQTPAAEQARAAWDTIALLWMAGARANNATGHANPVGWACNDTCNAAHKAASAIANTLGFEDEAERAWEYFHGEQVTGEQALTHCLDLAWDNFEEALAMAMARAADGHIVAAVGASVDSTAVGVNWNTDEPCTVDMWREAVYIAYHPDAVALDDMACTTQSQVDMLASLAPLASAAFNAQWTAWTASL